MKIKTRETQEKLRTNDGDDVESDHKVTKYYHVVEDGWDGGALQSLYSQHGEAAYDIFCERWPEAELLSYEHSHRIHLHATLNEAIKYQSIYGGDMLEISLDEDAEEEVFIIIDDLEYPHPAACYDIPVEYIKYKIISTNIK